MSIAYLEFSLLQVCLISQKIMQKLKGLVWLEPITQSPVSHFVGHWYVVTLV